MRDSWIRGSAVVASSTMAFLCASVVVPASSAHADDLMVVSVGADNVVRVNGNTGDLVEMVDAGVGGMANPYSIDAGADGDWYVASFGSGDVLHFDGLSGDPIEVFIPGGTEGLDGPTCAKWGPDGLLYVSSYRTDEIMRFDATGTYVDTFITAGLGGLDGPDYMYWRPLAPHQIDPNMYVISRNTNQVLRYNATSGAFVDVYIDAGANGIDHPASVVWHDDLVYVEGFNTGNIQRYDRLTGAFVDEWQSDLPAPHRMEIGPDGLLYVLAGDANGVARFNLDTGAVVDVLAQDSRFLSQPFDFTFVPSRALELVAPVPGIAGRENTMGVNDATPGATVKFFYGTQPGRRSVQGCPPLGIDMRNPTLIGSSVADATGTALLTVFIPNQGSGRSIALQAVDDTGCLVSDLLLFQFE